MRAASVRGELAAGADTTDALTAAVNLVRHARDNRLKLGELVEDWADQDRLLGGEALSPATRAYLDVFFQDAALKRPASAEAIADALTRTATRALDTTPGPDLWGESHAFDAATILERAAREARDAHARDAGAGAGDRPGPDRPGNAGRGQEDEGGGSGLLRGQGERDPGQGSRNGPDLADVEQAAGKDRSAGDPDIEELDASLEALEAELRLYVEDGRLDEGELEAAMADAVDGETWDTAIGAATACLAQGDA